MIIDDANTVLTEAKVKVVRGVSEAKVKLKFPMAGVQTLYIIYQPEAQSQQEGFTPSFTSTMVTVAATAKKGKGGKTRAQAVAALHLGGTAPPAGPRGLHHPWHEGGTHPQTT